MNLVIAGGAVPVDQASANAAVTNQAIQDIQTQVGVALSDATGVAQTDPNTALLTPSGPIVVAAPQPSLGHVLFGLVLGALAVYVVLDFTGVV